MGAAVSLRTRLARRLGVEQGTDTQQVLRQLPSNEPQFLTREQFVERVYNLTAETGKDFFKKDGQGYPRGVLPPDSAPRPIRKAYISDVAILKEQTDPEIAALAHDPSRVLRYTITTATPDRMKDIITARGWHYDAWLQNPVVLWAHDYHSLPVGRGLAIHEFDNGLKADAEFATRDLYPFADVVFQLTMHGYLRAVSVGLNPLKWSFNEDDWDPETEWFPPIIFEEQELLEFSAVPVPANAEALLSARTKGIDLQPMLDWATKTLDEWSDGETGKRGLWVPRKDIEAIYSVLKDPTTTIDMRDRPTHGEEGRLGETGRSSEFPKRFGEARGIASYEQTRLDDPEGQARAELQTVQQAIRRARSGGDLSLATTLMEREAQLKDYLQSGTATERSANDGEDRIQGQPDGIGTQEHVEAGGRHEGDSGVRTASGDVPTDVNVGVEHAGGEAPAESADIAGLSESNNAQDAEQSATSGSGDGVGSGNGAVTDGVELVNGSVHEGSQRASRLDGVASAIDSEQFYAFTTEGADRLARAIFQALGVHESTPFFQTGVDTASQVLKSVTFRPGDSEIVKSGRTLSKSNENKLSQAKDLLEEVLASVQTDGEEGSESESGKAQAQTQPQARNDGSQTRASDEPTIEVEGGLTVSMSDLVTLVKQSVDRAIDKRTGRVD